MRARSELSGAVAVAAGLMALVGCGGGERQDEDAPEGDFAVDVTRASFPSEQRLGASSELVIGVRNAGDRTIPDVALTLTGLDVDSTEPGLANAARPQFAIDGVPREIGGLPDAKAATPAGCDTAYVDTWACGPLRPGRTRTFRWSVTAVKAGPYRIRWRLAPGLQGQARAVAVAGAEPPRGSFSGRVSDRAPRLRVAEDGKSVTSDAP